jgi:hypothetical protein
MTFLAICLIFDTFSELSLKSGPTVFLSGWTGFCLARLDDSAQFGIIGINVANRIKEGKIKGSAAMSGYSILISGLRALR